ncbi:MAG: hypothetical protein ACOC93_02135 [Planctomycetota bacterium]
MQEKEKHKLLGVHLTDRVTEAVEVQRLLTEFGTNIKTRIGLHEIEGEYSAPNGLIMLEMVGADQRANELKDRLNGIEGVESKMIVFEHAEA